MRIEKCFNSTKEYWGVFEQSGSIPPLCPGNHKKDGSNMPVLNEIAKFPSLKQAKVAYPNAKVEEYYT